MELNQHLFSILNQFEVANTPTQIKRFGKGHINDTYLVAPQGSQAAEAFILQKINKHIFKDPRIIENNNRYAFEHLAGKSDLLLQPIKAKNGTDLFVRDDNADYWRLMPYVANSIALEHAATPIQARIAANSFGQLIFELSDIDTGLFRPSIDNFNNIETRYFQFKSSLEINHQDRNKSCQEEISFVDRHYSIIHEMTVLSPLLPTRITHNDTKINNILFDKDLKKCLHIIDLDTLMPGFLIHDFGDMVRTFSCPSSEDEVNLDKVFLRPAFFEALVQGFIAGCGRIITAKEKQNFIFGSKVMTFMMGIRFLTDYLNGDTYYKISFQEHNLIRAKNQFKLLKSMIDQENRLHNLVNSL